MYAVIEMQGHQYIVEKGTEIVVDKLDVESGKKHKSNNVLALFEEDGKNVTIGKPYVEGVEVTFDIVEHKKGEKIKVVKFKRKNRYHKTMGFRPHHTILTVKNIKVND